MPHPTRKSNPFLNYIQKLEDIIMSKFVKTGEIVPISGQYKAQKSNTEVTFVKGNRVPPTKNGATTFTLVDATKHKGGA